jgi:hypothetical protein
MAWSLIYLVFYLSWKIASDRTVTSTGLTGAHVYEKATIQSLFYYKGDDCNWLLNLSVDQSLTLGQNRIC